MLPARSRWKAGERNTGPMAAGPGTRGSGLEVLTAAGGASRTKSAMGSAARTISTPSACSAPCQSTARVRSEEHTSELQSRENLVCRLLLEKKKTNIDSSYDGKRSRH